MNQPDKSKLLNFLRCSMCISVIGWIAAGWLFPSLLTQLYESSYGDTLRLSRYPLERWLKQWNSVWARGLIVGSIAWLAMYAISSERFRNWYDRFSPLSSSSLKPPRSRRSRAPFYFLGAIILIGQSVDILISREHWPFSHFPMYTGIQTTDYVRYRVDGVLADGTEISLTPYFVPLSPGKIGAVVVNRGNRDLEKHANRCAAEYFNWYSTSRELGRHDGPEITRLKIYHLQWVLQEDASNLDSPLTTLVSEFPLTGKNE